MKKQQSEAIQQRNPEFSEKIDERIMALLSDGKKRTAYEIGRELNMHWSLALDRLSLLRVNKKVEETREGNIIHFSRL